MQYLLQQAPAEGHGAKECKMVHVFNIPFWHITANVGGERN